MGKEQAVDLLMPLGLLVVLGLVFRSRARALPFLSHGARRTYRRAMIYWSLGAAWFSWRVLQQLPNPSVAMLACMAICWAGLGCCLVLMARGARADG